MASFQDLKAPAVMSWVFMLGPLNMFKATSGIASARAEMLSSQIVIDEAAVAV